VAVPLLSVSAQEIDLVTPFELATKSVTTIQVQYNEVKSNPVQAEVYPWNLQVLAVLNEDFTVNSASNPAKKGSTIVLYVAGVGNTNPPSQDGQINAAPFAAPPMPFRLASPDYTPISTVSFAGAAPGLAAGIFQINFVPPEQTSGSVQLQVGQGLGNFNVFVQQ